jgi:hypothetical protein
MVRLLKFILFVNLCQFAYGQSNTLLNVLDRQSDTLPYQRLIVYATIQNMFDNRIYTKSNAEILLDWANQHDDDNVKLESICWEGMNFVGDPHVNIQLFLKGVEFSKEINSPIQEANCYFFMAMNYDRNNEKIKAFEYFSKACDLYSQLGIERIPGIYLRSLEYGNFLYRQKEYESALKWFFISKKFFDSRADYVKMHLLNNIGLSYKSLKENKKSLYNNLQALNIAKKEDNKAWISILSGNLADNYIAQKEYKKAISYLQTSIRFAEADRSLIGDLIEGKIRLAQCYININEPVLAIKLLQQTDSFVYKNGVIGTQINYNLQYALYYKLKSDGVKELFYYKKYIELKDSANKEIFNNQYINNRIKLEAEQNLQKVAHLNAVKKAGDHNRNLIILSLILIVILVILILFYKINRYKQKQLLLKLTADNLEQERVIKENKLLIAEQKLQEFTNYIVEKNNLIEQIQDEVLDKKSNELKKVNKEVEIEKISELSQLTILTEGDWLNFKTLFETAFPKFITNLNVNYPQLTKMEHRFICLSKLKLSNKDLANMLAISASSVHQLKYRLKQKLNQSGFDISELLE